MTLRWVFIVQALLDLAGTRVVQVGISWPEAELEARCSLPRALLLGGVGLGTYTNRRITVEPMSSASWINLEDGVLHTLALLCMNFWVQTFASR
jgi:hypothetical protein